MNSLQPLLALLSHAERERDVARGQAHRAAEAHRRARVQAEQLRGYRDDQDARFALQGGEVDILRCYRSFVGRLGEAIDHQELAVQHAARASAQAGAALRALELQVASVGKLLERRRAEARQVADRRSTKAADEFASRAAWSRPPVLGAPAEAGPA